LSRCKNRSMKLCAISINKVVTSITVRPIVSHEGNQIRWIKKLPAVCHRTCASPSEEMRLCWATGCRSRCSPPVPRNQFDESYRVAPWTDPAVTPLLINGADRDAREVCVRHDRLGISISVSVSKWAVVRCRSTSTVRRNNRNPHWLSGIRCRARRAVIHVVN